MTVLAAQASVAAVSRLRRRLPSPRSLRIVVGAGVGLSALSVVRFGISLHALIGAYFAVVLLMLTATDLERREIPNVFVLPATAVALVLEAASPHHLLVHVAAGLGFGGAFFLLATVHPNGLGMGDAKLALFLGLVLGSLTLAALVATSLAVFAGALVIVLRHGRSARRASIPFAPYLAFGALVVFFLQ
jgi:leader peptidase (prepilin peptidase) / N-methyltransferase